MEVLPYKILLNSRVQGGDRQPQPCSGTLSYSVLLFFCMIKEIHIIKCGSSTSSLILITEVPPTAGPPPPPPPPRAPPRALRWRSFMFNGHICSWMEVGRPVRLPQTPLPLLLFLPGQSNHIYVKMRIMLEFYRWGPPKPALFTSLVMQITSA